MPLSPGWEAAQAIKSAEPVAVRGEAFRAHFRTRDALDATGYHWAEGRFHRGGPGYRPEDTWPALYLSSTAHIAQGEYTRHLHDLSGLRLLRITTLDVDITTAADCRDLQTLGLTEGDLIADLDARHPDYRAGQALAAAAIRAGYEAIIVPTATRFEGFNLVVFTASLNSRSSIRILGHEDPKLYQGP